jgi:hypothetical protein
MHVRLEWLAGERVLPKERLKVACFLIETRNDNIYIALIRKDLSQMSPLSD